MRQVFENVNVHKATIDAFGIEVGNRENPAKDSRSLDGLDLENSRRGRFRYVVGLSWNCWGWSQTYSVKTKLDNISFSNVKELRLCRLPYGMPLAFRVLQKKFRGSASGGVAALR